MVASFFLGVKLQLFYDNEVLAGAGKPQKFNEFLYNSTYPIFKEKLKKEEKNTPVVLVNFWAAWCKPCLQEFPSLNKVHRKFSHLKVIGVNQDSDKVEFRKAEKKYSLNFFSFWDHNHKISTNLKVESYPFSILYCKGKAVGVYSGETNFQEKSIEDKIKECGV